LRTNTREMTLVKQLMKHNKEKEMKRIYPVILCMIMSLAITGIMTNTVKADEATLATLEVQAQGNNGDRTDVVISPAFSPDVTEYNATVPNDTIKLVITATVSEEGSVYDYEWEAMDVGDNETYIHVTAADGTKQTYTIYTKRLTREEEETWEPEEVTTEAPEVEAPPVMIGEVEMKITGNFTEFDIPEKFVATTYTYGGVEVPAIIGEKKPLLAMWLEPTAEETEVKPAFYIYDETTDSFAVMSNIYVSSRMFTIVTPDTIDVFLEDYEKVSLTVVDTVTEAWVLDEANKLYLLYAMNWEGDINLYCYDDVEKCLERYIIDSASATALASANNLINELNNKNKQCVDKFNENNKLKWMAIAVLLIIIVILFFVSLNLALKLKTKRVKEEDDEEDYEEEYKRKLKEERKLLERREREKRENFYYDDEDDDELFKLVEEPDTKPRGVYANLNEESYKNIFMKEDKEESKPIEENVKAESKPVEENVKAEPERESFLADNSVKETPVVQPVVIDNTDKTFNEEKLKDILSTAFPKEDSEDDDDGFTFIN